MDDDNSLKYIKILSIILIIGGLLVVISGFNYNPGIKIEYEGKFNQSYAENQSSTILRGSRLKQSSTTDNSISPDDVHQVINRSELNQNSSSKIDDIIETNNTTTVIQSDEVIPIGKSIVKDDMNEYHIIKSTLDTEYSPLQIIFIGFSSTLLGIYMLKRLSNSGVDLPDNIKRSEDSSWKYDFED